ncbi:MAG: SRPBCC family protein [Marmoricola sp.]
MSDTETRTIVAQIVIAATPERIWAAMTDPEQTEQWYFGTRVRCTWEPGASIEYVDGDGDVQLAGEIIECEPRRRLVHTFRATWSPDIAEDPASRYEFRIEPMGEALCQVTIEHSGIPVGTATDQQVEGGATLTLSSMKTLIETGQPLPLG